jgi:hypothetical protein
MSCKAAAVSVSVLSRKSNATEEFDELIKLFERKVKST